MICAFLLTKIFKKNDDIINNSKKGLFTLNNLSIVEIKEMLNQDLVTEETIEQLKLDSRKGVQQALKVYQNKQAKAALLFKQFQEMKKYETENYQQGKQLIAGIDEVGRGPLAGPVVAAAVILPKNFTLIGLTDSKKLSIKQRESYAEVIKQQAIAIGISEISPQLIDEKNIYQASILAMEQAVEQLALKPDHLLIDAVPLPNLPYSSDVIVKGDQKSISIAAASVIAKVHRDQIMAELHKVYPHYQFDQNQGYGTKGHLQGLKSYGITPAHRKSFAPIKDYLKGGSGDGTTLF